MNINIIIAFILSLLISAYTLSQLIGFSIRKNLVDLPLEARKLHLKATSNLGGIAIFIGTLFSYFAFSDYSSEIRPDKLFSIAVILFFIGLKDDIEPIGVWKRLFVEFICAFFIIYLTNLHLTSLYGFFGINGLAYWHGVLLSAIFVVSCINAYNMIDGIDGLLGSLALFASIVFGLVFNAADQWLWTLLCVALSGSLISFLIFNWQPARIFMGDGGSMLLGSFFACIALKTMQLPTVETNHFTITMPHVITFGIISIPVMDTITVTLTRIFCGDSPFKADNKHIHHRLLRLGLQHWQATLVLVAINLMIIIFAYYMQSTGALRSLIYTFLFCSSFFLFIIFLSSKYTSKQNIKNLQ